MSSSQAICTDLDALLAYEDQLGYSKPSTSFWAVESPEPRQRPITPEDEEPVLKSLPLPPRHVKKRATTPRRPKSAGGTPVMLQTVLAASMSRSATPDSIISDDNQSTFSHQSSPAVLPSLSRRNPYFNPYLNPVPSESLPTEQVSSSIVDSPQSWCKVLSDEGGSSDGAGSVSELGEWVGLSREDGPKVPEEPPEEQDRLDLLPSADRNSRLKKLFPMLGRRKGRPTTADASSRRATNSPLNSRSHSSSASADMYVPTVRQLNKDRAALPYTSRRLHSPGVRRRPHVISHASAPAGAKPQYVASISCLTTTTSETTAHISALSRPYSALHGHHRIYISPQDLTATLRTTYSDNRAEPASSVFHLDPSEILKMSDFQYKPDGTPNRPFLPTSKSSFFTTSKSTSNPSLRPKTSPTSSPSPRNEAPDRSLGTHERAHLVRKSRKLTQMFGETPHAKILVSSSFLELGSPVEQPKDMPNVLDISKDNSSLISRRDSRRHSTPITPDQISFASHGADLDATGSLRRKSRKRSGKTSMDTSSRASFISLSDDEETSDLDVLSPITPVASYTRARIERKPSTQSFSTLSPEEEAEAERRRNREKLAKLHRFLGSRVPTNLVLGVDDPLLSLASSSQEIDSDKESKLWMRRRNSSSAALPIPPLWTEEGDRTSAELDDEEKARNVRRAVKMERVFGVAPPQTLYHTRHAPGLSISTQGPPMIHLSSFDFAPLSTKLSSAPNTPSTLRKRTRPNSKRSSSRDSNEHLLPSKPADYFSGASDTSTPIYAHYQHSLKSLNDMIDRDDRESLAQLHEYLNADAATPMSNTLLSKRPSVSSSTKSERRRSLPTRASNASLASQFTLDSLTLASPPPDVTEFQIRRRRAAKLMSFFGVDYKELITDVLNSIEEGVDNESLRGTMNADEVEDLLGKLRQIKVKRDGLF